MKKSHLYSITDTETEEELFDYICSSFKDNITPWEYFVNWKKVFENVKSIEKELNILNYLLGKRNLEKELPLLIKEYPQIITAFPALIALRANSIDILTDVSGFVYKRYDFKMRKLTDEEVGELSEFVIQSGIGDILSDRKVKNLVDYVMGVEVGLDSNGRKNRGGALMEKITETNIKDLCKRNRWEYLSQATAAKIKSNWNIDVKVDKSSRIIDFAVKKDNRLTFVEVNFYGGGGSKLKSTATEYREMHRYWQQQGIDFIWITDGKGWKSTLKPLREYFDAADYLLTLEMVQKGVLEKVLETT